MKEFNFLGHRFDQMFAQVKKNVTLDVRGQVRNSNLPEVTNVFMLIYEKIINITQHIKITISLKE